MLDQLREQMAAFLLQHNVCVLSTTGGHGFVGGHAPTRQGAWAMPVRYHLPSGNSDNRMLVVDCLLPRWADVSYCLEQDPRVLLVIRDDQADDLRWLQVLGTVEPVAAPDWANLLPKRFATARPEDLYRVVRVTPERMDLFDESRGWGARETLKIKAWSINS